MSAEDPEEDASRPYESDKSSARQVHICARSPELVQLLWKCVSLVRTSSVRSRMRSR